MRRSFLLDVPFAGVLDLDFAFLYRSFKLQPQEICLYPGASSISHFFIMLELSLLESELDSQAVFLLDTAFCRGNGFRTFPSVLQPQEICL